MQPTPAATPGANQADAATAFADHLPTTTSEGTGEATGDGAGGHAPIAPVRKRYFSLRKVMVDDYDDLVPVSVPQATGKPFEWKIIVKDGRSVLARVFQHGKDVDGELAAMQAELGSCGPGLPGWRPIPDKSGNRICTEWSRPVAFWQWDPGAG